MSWLGLATGVCLMALLTLRTGVGDIAGVFAAAGPALFALSLFHGLQLGPHILAWGAVFAPQERPPWVNLAGAMWVGQSVNFLVPTANIGGELLKMRLLILWRAPQAAAIASVIADKTTQALAAVGLLAMGFVILLFRPSDGALILGIALGAVAMGAGVAGFVRAQRVQGVSRLLARIAKEDAEAKRPRLARLKASAAEVEAALDAIYRRPRRVAGAVALRIFSAVALSLEVWVAAALMGLEMSLWDAVALRVAGFAARSAAFFVWGGLGVQEGMFAAVGVALGYSPASLIALSLATRLRETVSAVPGVAFWLWTEGHRMVRAGSPDRAGAESAPAATGGDPSDGQKGLSSVR